MYLRIAIYTFLEDMVHDILVIIFMETLEWVGGILKPEGHRCLYDTKWALCELVKLVRNEFFINNRQRFVWTEPNRKTVA